MPESQAQRAEPEVRLEKRLLRHVLRLVCVSQHPIDQRADAGPVTRGQNAERGPVPRQAREGELPVTHAHHR